MTIPATLVQGFLDSGKTTWIQDCVTHDYFHRRGSTLILCFESGEAEYDEDVLAGFRARVEYCPPDEDPGGFCLRQLEAHRPDRVFVELNAMRPELIASLPDSLKPVFRPMLVDGLTLPLYARNLRAQLQAMAQTSDQITFNRCPDRARLQPFGQLFRLMNRRAVCLWEGPGGYHEKAFDLFVPFDLDQPALTFSEADLIPFLLDAAANPAHYRDKAVTLTVQVGPEADECRVGRTVMTCCMADLQFLSVRCAGLSPSLRRPRTWLRLTARGEIAPGPYGQPALVLQAIQAEPAPPPENEILS